MCSSGNGQHSISKHRQDRREPILEVAYSSSCNGPSVRSIFLQSMDRGPLEGSGPVQDQSGPIGPPLSDRTVATLGIASIIIMLALRGGLLFTT